MIIYFGQALVGIPLLQVYFGEYEKRTHVIIQPYAHQILQILRGSVVVPDIIQV